MQGRLIGSGIRQARLRARGRYPGRDSAAAIPIVVRRLPAAAMNGLEMNSTVRPPYRGKAPRFIRYLPVPSTASAHPVLGSAESGMESSAGFPAKGSPRRDPTILQPHIAGGFWDRRPDDRPCMTDEEFLRDLRLALCLWPLRGASGRSAVPLAAPRCLLPLRGSVTFIGRGVPAAPSGSNPDGAHRPCSLP